MEAVLSVVFRVESFYVGSMYDWFGDALFELGARIEPGADAGTWRLSGGVAADVAESFSEIVSRFAIEGSRVEIRIIRAGGKVVPVVVKKVDAVARLRAYVDVL